MTTNTTDNTQQTTDNTNPNRYPVYPTPTEQDHKTNPFGEH